jgi:hypothetical protein
VEVLEVQIRDVQVGKAFCGIDWAEGHHDIALVDELGRLVA